MSSIHRRTALLQMGVTASAAFIAETLHAEGFPNSQFTQKA